jgi:hypothetical protein
MRYLPNRQEEEPFDNIVEPPNWQIRSTVGSLQTLPAHKERLPATVSGMYTALLGKQFFSRYGPETLKEMCGQYGLKQARIVDILATKGIKADPEKSLQEIASTHGTDPHELFALMHETATRQ